MECKRIKREYLKLYNNYFNILYTNVIDLYSTKMWKVNP